MNRAQPSLQNSFIGYIVLGVSHSGSLRMEVGRERVVRDPKSVCRPQSTKGWFSEASSGSRQWGDGWAESLGWKSIDSSLGSQALGKLGLGLLPRCPLWHMNGQYTGRTLWL